jgi:hypothetical protein
VNEGRAERGESERLHGSQSSYVLGQRLTVGVVPDHRHWMKSGCIQIVPEGREMRIPRADGERMVGAIER